MSVPIVEPPSPSASPNAGNLPAAANEQQPFGGIRELLKTIARALAVVMVLPWLLAYWLKTPLVGRDRALEGSSESLGLVPGMLGKYLRRAFLTFVLAECHPTSSIGFGVLLSKAGARIGPNVYVGPRCHLGLVTLERDVLLAAGVHVTSGAETHGYGDLTRPIRDQAGTLTMVRIGAGAWIGSNSVVMADVGRDTIVGAGSVVNRPLPEEAIAAGVPARVIRFRREVPVSGKAD